MTATYYLLNEGTQYDIQEFELKKETERSINTCDVSIVKTAVSNFDIGDEPSLMYWNGSSSTELFQGRVSDKSENLTGKITVESYGAIINHVTADEVFNSQSPEYIAQYLIENYTDLTYASTATSGVTISRFVCNTENVGDSFKRLMDLLKDWVIKSDNNKNFYFEPKTTTYSSESVTINENAYLINDWNRNPDKIINKITLVGDVQTFNTDQTETATASQTVFTLDYRPKGNVKVTDNGTELTGGVSGATGTYDYVYDKDNLTVTFSVGRTVGHTIVLSYEYEVPIKITAQNDASIASYGERSTKVTDKTIRTMTDARTYVQNYLASNSQVDLNGEFNVDLNRNINEGELLPVIDSFNNINTILLVNSVVSKFPEGLKTVKVGRVPFDSLKNQKELIERLRKLEQEADNTTLLQVYREIVEPLNIDFTETTYKYQIDVNDSWVWGVSRWGVDKWGDRRNGALIATNWSLTNASITSQILTMSPGGIALYLGTGNTIIDGKIIINFDISSSAGDLYIFFRTGALHYYALFCDIANNQVSFINNITGTISSIVSKTFSLTNNTLTIRFHGTKLILNDETTLLIEITDSSVTATGTIYLENHGNTITVNNVKIAEGL